VRRHKAWSDCSGERDPAAFLPATTLRTAAGIDRDYNFLAGIERARRQGQKDVLGDEDGKVALVTEAELKGPSNGEDARFEKIWYGDQLHHVPARGGPGARWRRGAKTEQRIDDGRVLLDKQVRRRLRVHDIQVRQMPRGMSRQRENKTAWNRRTNTVNWQVEWLVLGGTDGLDVSIPRQDEAHVFRVLHKSLDETPIFQAFADSLDWYRAGTKRAHAENDDDESSSLAPPKKRRKGPGKRGRACELDMAGQSPEWTTWPPSEYAFQNTITGAWDLTSSTSSLPVGKAEQVAALVKWQFFLSKAWPLPVGDKELIPLSSTESLVSALRGRTVVEFPSIYILHPSMVLPQGYILASTERRQRQPEEISGDERQKYGRRPFERRQHASTRWKKGDRPSALGATENDAEDGEVNSDGKLLGDDVDKSESSDSSSDNHVYAEVEANEQASTDERPVQRTGLVDYNSATDSDMD
jgi:hypothetical protein